MDIVKSNAVVATRDIIVLPGRNPREECTGKHISELAESIRIEGLRIPLLLQKKADGLLYLISGENRLRALRYLEMATAQSIVYENLPDEMADIMALEDNIQHAVLKPVELSFAVKKLKDTYHLSQDEIATKLKKKQRYIGHLLTIAERISPEVQELIQSGELKQTYARALSKLDKPLQISAAQVILRSHMDTDGAFGYINQLLNRPDEGPSSDKKTVESIKRLMSELKAEVENYYNKEQSDISVDDLKFLVHDNIRIRGLIQHMLVKKGVQ